MSNIVDRRKNTKGKSLPNRQKFLKRLESQIKKALPKVMKDGTMKDLAKKDGKIRVPVKGIKEPKFRYNYKTGRKDYVRPGNDKYTAGDKIKKPKGAQGQAGRKGSKEGEGTDEFAIDINKEEFFKYFFDDLELPNLVKKFMSRETSTKMSRAGYTTSGIPARLNIKESLKKSMARRIGVKSIFDKKLKKLEEEYEKNPTPELLKEIERVRKQAKTIPFLDDIDLKYNNFEPRPEPITQAVMFCVMDVSASMGQREKDIAKRFYFFLYLFLLKQYKDVDIIYIRHHTKANEVDEDEFFNARETGGTIVAPALKLAKDIIDERYDLSKWNIYLCQASDGDVWGRSDAQDCVVILSKLLKEIQYMAYVEIGRDVDSIYSTVNNVMESVLWQEYSQMERDYGNFAMKYLNDVNEIWPVFKSLFKKKVKDVR